jgi:phosphonate transport system substrate-binding protein
MRKKAATVAIAIILVAMPAFARANEAQLGTKENPIVWAFVPSGESAVASAELVAKLLHERTKLWFAIRAASESIEIIEALSSKPPEVHLASLETVPYIVAADRGAAEVALIAFRFGDVFYRGQIIANANSGVKEMTDLAGKTFARPDPQSNSGWFFPMLTMLAAGINPDRDLKAIVDAGSHDTVVEWVYYGDVDAGASFVGANSQLKVKVIEISVNIPHEGIHFHPSVPEGMRRKITGALLEIADTRAGRDALNAAFQWSGLESHDDSIYDPFRQLIRDSGIDVQDLLK